MEYYNTLGGGREAAFTNVKTVQNNYTGKNRFKESSLILTLFFSFRAGDMREEI